jgi:putative endonuclease
MADRKYFVYILASKKHGTLYAGVTNDLKRRIAEHRDIKISSFTGRYKTFKLVYYEILDAPKSAIAREKQLKAGSRAAKIRLVEGMNPGWEDLYSKL